MENSDLLKAQEVTGVLKASEASVDIGCYGLESLQLPARVF